MKLKQILVLILILATLSGLYAAMNWRKNRQVEQAIQAGKVFSFSPDSIRSLTLSRADESPVSAERVSPETWKITSPNSTIKPFHLMWNRVSQHLSDLMNERSLPPSITDMAQYGLDKPTLTVEAVVDNDRPVRLQLGAMEPTQRHHYARLDDGGLFLVSTEAYFELNRSLKDLRHRFLVRDREAPLLELEFAWIWTGVGTISEGEPIPEVGQESTLIRVRRTSVDSPWKLVEPVEAFANHEKVEALVNEIQFSVCDDFIDTPENLSDYGLQPPRARITVLEKEGGERQTLWLGSADESAEKKGLFIKAEGQDAVMILGGQILTLLPRSPLEWRDLRLITRRVKDIMSLEFTSGGDRFVLEKTDGGKWKITQPEIKDVNDLALNGFLQFIKEASGDALVEDPRTDDVLKEPTTTINLRYEDDTASTIAVAPHPETQGTYWARQDTGGVVSVSGVTANMLLTDSSAFQSREILRFVKEELTGFRFSLDGQDYQYTKENGTWSANSSGQSSDHNQADIDTLLEALSPLNALGIETESTPVDLSPYGLSQPVFTITLQFEKEGESTRELSATIGGPNPENSGERYAMSSARTGIFRVSQDVMDQVREAARGLQ